MKPPSRIVLYLTGYCRCFCRSPPLHRQSKSDFSEWIPNQKEDLYSPLSRYYTLLQANRHHDPAPPYRQPKHAVFHSLPQDAHFPVLKSLSPFGAFRFSICNYRKTLLFPPLPIFVLFIFYFFLTIKKLNFENFIKIYYSSIRLYIDIYVLSSTLHSQVFRYPF